MAAPKHPYKTPPKSFLFFWSITTSFSDDAEPGEIIRACIVRGVVAKEIPTAHEPTSELALIACAVEARYPNALNPYSPGFITEIWNRYADRISEGGAEPHPVSVPALRAKCEQSHKFLLA